MYLYCSYSTNHSHSAPPPPPAPPRPLCPSLPLPSTDEGGVSHRPCQRDIEFNVPSAPLRYPGTHFTLNPRHFFFSPYVFCLTLKPAQANSDYSQFSSLSSHDQHWSLKVRRPPASETTRQVRRQVSATETHFFLPFLKKKNLFFIPCTELLNTVDFDGCEGRSCYLAQVIVGTSWDAGVACVAGYQRKCYHGRWFLVFFLVLLKHHFTSLVCVYTYKVLGHSFRFGVPPCSYKRVFKSYSSFSCIYLFIYFVPLGCQNDFSPLILKSRKAQPRQVSSTSQSELSSPVWNAHHLITLRDCGEVIKPLKC